MCLIIYILYIQIFLKIDMYKNCSSTRLVLASANAIVTCAFCSFSVIGAAIIVLGLYALIWGKSKDHENQVADVSASGGSKGGAAAGELPITLAQPNGNGKHEQLGNTRGHVFDVETPAATNGHY